VRANASSAIFTFGGNTKPISTSTLEENVAKGRVLVLCGQAPWLRNGGALLRNYWMIDALRRNYAVDLVVADEPGPIPASFAALVDDYASFPRAAAERGGLSRLMRAAMPRESSLTAGWTSLALREYVANRLGRHPYAAIQVDLPMQGALPRRDAIPIVYNAHNCESALLARRATTEPPLARAALMFDERRVRGQERALAQRAALVAACALQDLQDFERFVPGVRAKTAIVPNGVDVRHYEPIRSAASETQTVLISGSMDWRPNVVGLRWFLRRVLPRLRSRVPGVTVRVAGRMHADLVAELRRYPNVEAVPNPPSMEPHLAAATVVAAPIVASSGTRLRILEAWAAGRAVMTTGPGAFGLDCTPGRELMIRDEPGAFADGLASMLVSPALRSSLVDQASDRVEGYDWQTIGTGLLAAYERVALEPPVRRIPTVSGEAVLSATL
jgi:glycosyltransferase involved in cell wall biosynthesis